MSKTPHLGLDVVEDGDDRAFKLWREAMAGDGETSNMRLIDKAFENLEQDITWDEYLPADEEV